MDLAKIRTALGDVGDNYRHHKRETLCAYARLCALWQLEKAADPEKVCDDYPEAAQPAHYFLAAGSVGEMMPEDKEAFATAYKNVIKELT